MSEIRLFTLSVTLAFLASFGGAHLLTDLLAPVTDGALDIVLLAVGLVVR